MPGEDWVSISSLNAAKKTLPDLTQLINTAQEFKDVFEFLYDVERKYVFDIMKMKLPEIIKTAEDFKNVFEFLSYEQKRETFRLNFQYGIYGINPSEESFQSILEFLPRDQQYQYNRTQTLQRYCNEEGLFGEMVKKSDQKLSHRRQRYAPK